MTNSLAILIVSTNLFTLTQGHVSALTHAIYKAENSKHHPFGIMSDTRHPVCEAQRMIDDAYQDWSLLHERNVGFVDFLSMRWCPPDADAQGNINWRRNVKWFLLHEK
jgi:hypothetical protein